MQLHTPQPQKSSLIRRDCHHAGSGRYSVEIYTEKGTMVQRVLGEIIWRCQSRRPKAESLSI